MIDFDSIWRTQDEIRTVVNAVNNLSCQFPITADYDGLGVRGSKFAFFL